MLSFKQVGQVLYVCEPYYYINKVIIIINFNFGASKKGTIIYDLLNAKI